MPAYTFVSTADAFVLRGAKAKFVDIRPDTMNMDEKLIEEAITEKTKAIVPVHTNWQPGLSSIAAIYSVYIFPGIYVHR